MVSDSLADVDLKEMAQWKRRNQQERFQMLDDYAKWLKERGLAVAEERKPRKKVAKAKNPKRV